MSQDMVLSYIQEAIYTVIIVSAPPLLLGLSVGIIVSIFQTITSIQEPTLAFVPKILAVMFGLIIFGSFMLTTLREYTVRLFLELPNIISQR